MEEVNSSSTCAAQGWNQPERWGSTIPSSAHQTQRVAAHIWGCAYTGEGYGSAEPCFFFHKAEVVPWIPWAGFQGWRETCWHSWMLSTWLTEMTSVHCICTSLIFRLHSHIKNEALNNTFGFFDCRQANELILLERFHLLLKILCRAKYVAMCQQYRCE